MTGTQTTQIDVCHAQRAYADACNEMVAANATLARAEALSPDHPDRPACLDGAKRLIARVHREQVGALALVTQLGADGPAVEGDTAPMRTIEPGTIALCSHNCPGLITGQYETNTGTVYVGYHLVARDGHHVGDHWQSRRPRPLALMADVLSPLLDPASRPGEPPTGEHVEDRLNARLEALGSSLMAMGAKRHAPTQAGVVEHVNIREAATLLTHPDSGYDVESKDIQPLGSPAYGWRVNRAGATFVITPIKLEAGYAVRVEGRTLPEPLEHSDPDDLPITLFGALATAIDLLNTALVVKD